MIETGTYNHFGTDHEYISIDLRTSKHKNRVIDFLETKNMVNDEFQYEIKAQWTEARFHPNMTMSESELIKLSKALNTWVQKIEERRASE